MRFSPLSFFVLVGLASISTTSAFPRGKVYIFDASVSLLLPTPQFLGVPALNEGQATPEIQLLSKIAGHNLLSPDAIRLHIHLMKVQEYYSTFFGRSSYDGNGSDLRASVNANRYLPIDPLNLRHNAFWSAEGRYFAFGHGTDDISSFSDEVEVVGHEFTHAVISSTSNLEYIGFSGALNEHLADLFGIFIAHFSNPQNPKPFLIGGSLLHGELLAKASALRDMEDPHRGLIWQPAHMNEIKDEYKSGCQPSPTNDSCGVHILSGIPNKASVGVIRALGWETAQSLFYKVMTERLHSKADFSDYRNHVVNECQKTLPELACKEVITAFQTVGL